MEYEKIILELLGRIKILEEQVAELVEDKKKSEVGYMTTENIREYIMEEKSKAKSEGKKCIVLVARDIHKNLNLKSRFPMVCNAMRQCMGCEDEILFQPPKGNSSTLEIKYIL